MDHEQVELRTVLDAAVTLASLLVVISRSGLCYRLDGDEVVLYRPSDSDADIASSEYRVGIHNFLVSHSGITIINANTQVLR